MANRRAFRGENGQIMVLFALCLTVLLGMVALAVDGGYTYLGRRWMQNGADAGSLAAARFMSQTWTGGAPTVSSSDTYRVAVYYVAQNASSASNPTVRLQYLDQNSAIVGEYPGEIPDSTRGVRVTATANLRAGFAALLGIPFLHPKANAAAMFGPAGKASSLGSAPIAVDASLQGDRSGLQPAGGLSGGTYVNVALLDTARFGSGQDFFDALAHGVRDDIVIGKSYPTSAPDDQAWRTSVVAALQDRINRGQARGDTPTSFSADSPQLLILPTVNGGFPNAPNPVQIFGFRAFFLLSVDPKGNFARGIFVSAPLTRGTIDYTAPCDPTSCVTVTRLTR